MAGLFASHICEPWPGEIPFFLANAGNPPPGDVVLEDCAFDSNGKPLFSVHDRLDGLMRRHADHLGVAIARPDVISHAEWRKICEEGQESWALGTGARRAVAGIAPIIARLAAEGKINCTARPIEGPPDAEPVNGRQWWDVNPNQAVRRIASSGLNMTSPFDPAIQPDRHIFVAQEGLEDVVMTATRQNYVSIAFMELGEWELRRKGDHQAVQQAEVTRFLIRLMDSGRFETARNEDFKHEVWKKFGSGALGRCYDQAKAAAVKDPSRSRFAKRRKS